MDKMIDLMDCPVDVLSHPSAQWSHHQSSHGIRDDGCKWTQQHGLNKAVAPHSSSCLENPMDGGAWLASLSLSLFTSL